MIDTSGGISFNRFRFKLIKEFISNIIAELIHDSPKSAVGVISFGNSAYIQFNLQTYTSLNSLLSAINNLPRGYGGADTAEALTLLLSSAQNGVLGLRNDSKKVAIVITDGRSSNSSATSSAAARLHASNIFDIYAVGIDGAYLPELEDIVSGPELVFFTHSFSNHGLQQLQDRIIPQLCACKLLISMYVVCMYICMYNIINVPAYRILLGN